MNSHLRICVIASSRFAISEPFAGGLEAHTHGLASALLARGHDVSLFAAPGSDPRLGATELPVARFASSPAARADVGSSPESWMREHHAYLDLMLGLARGRYGHFDIVHNNSLHHLPVALSELLPMPVVTTLHTPPVPWLESALSFAPATNTYVAVSESVCRAWRHAVKSVTIPNGVDTTFWLAGLGGGPAIWSGRIVAEKAPHEAIESARRAGIRIDLAGPVHDVKYFDQEVRPRLNDSARYLGHLNRLELRGALQAASVAVVTPQWDEPFGLVAAEAMACGTPVAAYDKGALGEIVDPDSGALARAGDLDGLAFAIRRASNLNRNTVRHRACSLFSQERMVESYERVYREMVGLVGAA